MAPAAFGDRRERVAPRLQWRGPRRHLTGFPCTTAPVTVPGPSATAGAGCHHVAMAPSRTTRTREDACPGVLRPWPAADGALVRLRIPGGHLAPGSLAALGRVAVRHGDGHVHLTSRANLQVRGLPAPTGCLEATVVGEIEATGLLPSRSHELVRNVLASPLTGLVGGRVDLRPVVAALDEGLCAAPELAALPARFLFVLDDGRGDVAPRRCDLGMVALDGHLVQLRVGDEWGEVVELRRAAERLLELAGEFLEARGSGPTAPWHVAELAAPLRPPVAPDPRLPVAGAPPGPGPVPGATRPVVHVPAPEGRLSPERVDELTGPGTERLVVTPWRSLVVVRA